MVIWIYGPSGAGKTTIGRALYKQFKVSTSSIIILDGDDFRAAMGDDLGFTLDDRRRNGHRLARMCLLLESQGIDVICCGATIHPEVQKFNRASFREYCEVFVEVSFETLLNRDTKNIYRRALDGELSDVIGVDIKSVPPELPHLILNNDEVRTSFEHFAELIMTHINGKTPYDVLQEANKLEGG